MRLREDAGFTLTEILIAFLISIFLFLAMFGGIVAIKSVAVLGQHHIQAMNVVRGRMEVLKGTPFNLLAPMGPTEVAFDAGADGVFGTADDLTGSLQVLFQDTLDMDQDGVTAEDWIDVDGDAINDTVARPIRVTFTWDQRLLGQNQQTTVAIDSLIAR